MKNLGKVLIVIVILGAILFGIYSILPEFSHNILRSMYQAKFDDEAKVKIKATQELTNPNLKQNYKTILESHTDTKGWVYDKSEDGSTETVTFYGNKVSLILKEIPDHEDMLYDGTTVKVTFVTDDEENITVNVYLGNSSTPVDDVVRPYVFAQLLNGSTTDE